MFMWPDCMFMNNDLQRLLKERERECLGWSVTFEMCAIVFIHLHLSIHVIKDEKYEREKEKSIK